MRGRRLIVQLAFDDAQGVRIPDDLVPDDLQAVIALLKGADVDADLQFTTYR